MDRPAGEIPPILRIDQADQIGDALAKFGLPLGRPVLVLVGGAGGMAQDIAAELDVVLRYAILPVVENTAAVVVDGGTDSGVMRAMGRVKEDEDATFPLVGVAAQGTVALSGRAPTTRNTAELEPHHTLVVLVPGATWGDESAWIRKVAGVVAAAEPSVTVLVNGGDIAFDDVIGSLEERRPVVVLSGTGRTANAIAAASHAAGADPRADRIARSALTTIVPIQDVDAVKAAVAAALAD